MNPSTGPIDKILDALQERAKELNCLLQVGERLSAPDAMLDDIFRGVIQVIPTGYQFPAVAQARITFEDRVFAPSASRRPPGCRPPHRGPGEDDRESGGLLHCADAARRRGAVPQGGTEAHRHDRGADRPPRHAKQDALASRRLADRFPRDRGRPAARVVVIIDFLRMTDRQLLIRLSRKMINHLCWNGIAEAQMLLQRYARTGARRRRWRSTRTGRSRRPPSRIS